MSLILKKKQLVPKTAAASLTLFGGFQFKKKTNKIIHINCEDTQQVFLLPPEMVKIFYLCT